MVVISGRHSTLLGRDRASFATAFAVVPGTFSDMSDLVVTVRGRCKGILVLVVSIPLLVAGAGDRSCFTQMRGTFCRHRTSMCRFHGMR